MLREELDDEVKYFFVSCFFFLFLTISSVILAEDFNNYEYLFSNISFNSYDVADIDISRRNPNVSGRNVSQNNVDYNKKKEIVDKFVKNIKINDFLSYEKNNEVLFNVMPPLAEIDVFAENKVDVLLHSFSFIQDFDHNIKDIMFVEDVIIFDERVSREKTFWYKYKNSGIIILTLSFIIAIILFFINYNKIISHNLKNIKNEDKAKMKEFYSDLLNNKDIKPKTKEEIKEELRKLSQNM